MLPMATSTTCRRNLAVLRAAEWGLLLTPDRPERWGFPTIGIDNGAWGCFQRKVEWTPERWQPLIDANGADALWSVAPDIVCGGPASLARSLEWLPWLLDRTPRALIAVQNGMTAADLRPFVGARVGLFVGGDTEWKEASLPMWGRLKAETGCFLHVGRVNSARRIRLCALAGADSFDGTSASVFSCTLPRLDTAARQQVWRFDA